MGAPLRERPLEKRSSLSPLYLFRLLNWAEPPVDARFFCDAIFCSKSGVFSYERFVQNYLERPFVLQIEALGVPKKGPHGGTIEGSAAHLWHDFTHAEEFLESMYWKQKEFDNDPRTKGMNYWDTLKFLLKKVYQSPHQTKRNQIALFLLLHQEGASLMDKASPELDHDTAMPMSERRFFWQLISGVMQPSRMLNTFFFEDGLGILASALNDSLNEHFDIDLKDVQELDSSSSQKEDIHITLRLTNGIQNQKTLEFEPVPMATLSIHVVFTPPSSHPGESEHRTINLQHISWTHEGMSSLSSQERSEIHDRVVKWTQRKTEPRQQERWDFFRAAWQDYEDMVYEVYGKCL